MNRDIDITTTPAIRIPKRVVASIGIDRYSHWPILSNAVNDATAALAAFVRMGFEPIVPAITNEHATADALRGLVEDALSGLTEDDQLVVFFAGHGYTETRMFADGDHVKTGFIIPADGNHPSASRRRWLRIDTWLSDISRLAARHILIVLDACHSGIALGSLVKTRDAVVHDEPFNELVRRRSRRVITSALDGQRAHDSGPMPRQSLFTGWLLEALEGGIASHGTQISGSQLGSYIQRKVSAHSDARQTPDFGALEEDRRGELVMKIVTTSGPLPVHGNTTRAGLVRLEDLTADDLAFVRLMRAGRRWQRIREAAAIGEVGSEPQAPSVATPSREANRAPPARAAESATAAGDE